MGIISIGYVINLLWKNTIFKYLYFYHPVCWASSRKPNNRFDIWFVKGQWYLQQQLLLFDWSKFVLALNIILTYILFRSSTIPSNLISKPSKTLDFHSNDLERYWRVDCGNSIPQYRILWSFPSKTSKKPFLHPVEKQFHIGL